MSDSYDLPQVGRFTAGAMGEPGRRVFYFQVFAAGTEVSLKAEKQQVQALAEHLLKLLGDLPDASPGVDPPAPAEALPPSDLAWIVGSISIGLDRDAGRLLVVFEEMPEVPDDEDTEDEAIDPATARVLLDPDQVRGFAAQVASLVDASRPLCRLCERPIDPDGHACPRLN